jgi:hypothetical protein
VEVLLGVVAVVADVEDLVVGQDPHRPIGVSVVRDMTRRARVRWARNRSWSSRICWLV